MTARNKKENNQSDLNSKTKSMFGWLAGLFVFFWPFVYLFNHIISINGEYTAVGNDFILLYYKYKVYLLACLAKFKFPLWSPSEAAGFPFFTNPFAQAFYPLNLPLTVWYRISGGYNPYDHQIFTIIGISIFALGLYKWLSLINKNTRAVILSAVIISISFKMTEILRFPNAVHTAAWYPWILYAITKIFVGKSPKGRMFSGLMLVLFIICLCTGGYSYYVYYSQFLVLPYVFVFLIRPLRQRLLGIDSIRLKPAFTTLSVCGIISGLICMPYLLAIRNLMSHVVDRASHDFNYSTDHSFKLVDTVGSLVYPPASQPEGWYFFSITALLIILLYLLAKTSDKSSADSSCSEGIVKIFFILWIAVISYISYGKDSYLFVFLWKYMPGFSSLRVWGRMNIILLPILAWLLSLALDYFESVITGSVSARQKNFWKRNQTVITLIVIYTVILSVQLYLIINKVYDMYWVEYLGYSLSDGMWFLYLGIAAFVVVLLILIIAKKYSFGTGKALIVISVVLATAAVLEMWPVGTHTWTIEDRPMGGRFNIDVDKTNQASFNYPRIYNRNSIFHGNTISLGPAFNAGVVPNWYFDSYIKFLKGHSDDLHGRDTLLGVISGQKVFFSESINYDKIKDFLEDAWRFKSSGYPWLYTGDKLEWMMNAPMNGYVSFIDNWDESWKAYVDGRETKIELLFGTFKSVAVEKGEHRIEFVYKPTFRTVLGIGENN